LLRARNTFSPEILRNRLAQPGLEAMFLLSRANIRRSIAFSLALGATLSGSAQIACAQTFGNSGPILAQATPPTAAPNVPQVPTLPDARNTAGTTILPTDVLPLPTIQNRMTFGENLQLRMLQKLPARFYFNASVESTFRYETNVFQFPKKSIFVRQLARNSFGFSDIRVLQQLSTTFPQNQLISQQLALVNREDTVFRVLPNINAGFQITPRWNVFMNYFMIRDSLMQNTSLNTTIQSIAYGTQKNWQFFGGKTNLQAQMEFRSLFQPHQDPVFDFLPGLTVSQMITPRTIFYVNALLQMRGRKYFQAPTREIDPFYTWGLFHQRGAWTFTATSTFVQNFREPFRQNASVPINNYSFILDFEVSRRLFRQLPGLQAFMRAEPIINFKSNETPGLAGTDFRLFWGLRFAVAKPALTTALDSLRRQLEEQEVAPPSPPSTPSTKPSAFLQPHQVVAATPQPIHGFLTDAGTPDETLNGTVSLIPAKLSPAQEIAEAESETSQPAFSEGSLGLSPHDVTPLEALPAAYTPATQHIAGAESTTTEL
jgi:hypothetical protein